MLEWWCDGRAGRRIGTEKSYRKSQYVSANGSTFLSLRALRFCISERIKTSKKASKGPKGGPRADEGHKKVFSFSQ